MADDDRAQSALGRPATWLLSARHPPAAAWRTRSFALSEPGAQASLARAGGLEPTREADVGTVWVYQDEATLLRGLLSAGPAVRALAAAGEARVRDAVLAVAPYRTPGGTYRLRNQFHLVVAMTRG